MRIAKELRKKLRAHINLGFTEALQADFVEQFPGVEIESSYNIFAMALVSNRADGKDFTPEQALFVKGYEAGYIAAMGRVS